jgi:Peptidase inhibitor I78 family
MDRTVLLALIMIGVMAGCGRRDDASAPETASPPTATTEPAPAELVPAEPVPAESAPAEAPPSASTPAAPVDTPVAEEAAVGADGCNAEPVQNLVGELYTPELGEQARLTAGARVERALHPGQIVTMEFRADRLSFTLDEKGRISRVSCG